MPPLADITVFSLLLLLIFIGFSHLRDLWDETSMDGRAAVGEKLVTEYQ